MKDNTELAYNGTQVYTNRIQELADEFINNQLDDKQREEMPNNPNTFMAMILYISDNIPKVDNNDIQQLDNIFNIYTDYVLNIICCLH